ncbi:MAG TPA: TetR/AcrR family transcriptional regulator [Trebonia sp.]|nr:TetR/AcrR family transcriptional regulator [Trebonia sp.]
MTAPGQEPGPHAGDGLAATAARGRPRSEKARRAILEAAAELLLGRGLSAVSMDAVAERAGVSKATIYRWWPTKETLALDALYTRWAAAAPVPGDTGSLRDDLLELLLPWVELVRTGPSARVIAALLTKARTDEAFAAEYRRHVIQPRREQARKIFDRAVARGEVPADLDLEVALDLVYGPLYHRLLQGHAPLDDDFVRAAVGLALTGITQGGEPCGGSSRNSLGGSSYLRHGYGLPMACVGGTVDTPEAAIRLRRG